MNLGFLTTKLCFALTALTKRREPSEKDEFCERRDYAARSGGDLSRGDTCGTANVCHLTPNG
jgi:hypothetical protein